MAKNWQQPKYSTTMVYSPNGMLYSNDNGQSTIAGNKMGDSSTWCGTKEDMHKRIHVVWFRLHKVQKQAKLISIMVYLVGD